MRKIVRSVIEAIIKNKNNAVLATFLLVSLMAGLFSVKVGSDTTEEVVAQEIALKKIVQISAGENIVGYVEETPDLFLIKNKAMENLVNELGYDPEVDILMSERTVVDDGKLISTVDQLVAKTKDVLYSSIGEIKQAAYVMKIGDDFTVALKDENDLKEVLEYSQKKYLSGDVKVEIDLSNDERNSMVMSPKLTISKEEDREFDAVSEPEDSEPGCETIEASFANDVIIVKSFVEEEQIADVKSAEEMITKENAKKKTYIVQEGDYPQVIAGKNEMGTHELYELNPGLADRDQSIQVGEELVVMVPEPELSVVTVESLTYEEELPCEVQYIENPDKFIGYEAVQYEGAPGIKTITANIEKINGKEISRTVVGEEITKEQDPKVLVIGAKPLPSIGATGKFIRPLEKYIITSPFGSRGGSHKGIDLAAPTGTIVRAADGGVVTRAGWYYGYGYIVIIDHGDGITTRYGHNSELLVSAGQYVSQFEAIAKVGSTGQSSGPHCHFEIRYDGVPVNPSTVCNF